MLKKVIILFDKNGFDLSGIKENIDIRCLNIDIKMKCDGYHQLTQNNNFDLNEENNYVYDYDSVLRGNPVHLGKLKFIGIGKNKSVEFEKL